jgi:hypothetical protein
MKTTKSVAEAWRILEEQLASQIRAHTVNVCMVLTISRKGNLTLAKCLAKMLGLSNDMATRENLSMIKT